MKQISEITTLIKDAAREAGFELAGIAPVRDLPELNYFRNGSKLDMRER